MPTAGQVGPEGPAVATALEIQGAAGIYAATWQDLHVRVDHIFEDKRSVSARFTFTTKLHPAPVTDQCNLVSGIAKKRMALMLEGGLGLLDARDYVEALCQGILARHQAGEPLIALATLPEPPPLAFLLRPLIVARHPVLIYGDGGTGKSTTACWLALLAQHGLAHAGVAANGVGGNVLYHDYEATAEDVGRTMTRLWRGMGQAGRPGVLYRRGSQALAHEADQLRLLVLDNAIQWIVVDSAVGALQADMNSPTDVGLFFGALRTLSVGVLILAHTQKGGEHKTPLGSGQWWNQAREVYEVAAAPGAGNSLTVALYHRKANYRRKLPPWGLRFDFGEKEDDDTSNIVVGRTDVTIVPELAEKLTHKDRIAGVLKRGKATVADIALVLGLSEDVVRPTLHRYPAMFGQDSSTRPPKWFLFAPPEAPNEPF